MIRYLIGIIGKYLLMEVLDKIAIHFQNYSQCRLTMHVKIMVLLFWLYYETQLAILTWDYVLGLILCLGLCVIKNQANVILKNNLTQQEWITNKNMEGHIKLSALGLITVTLVNYNTILFNLKIMGLALPLLGLWWSYNKPNPNMINMISYGIEVVMDVLSNRMVNLHVPSVLMFELIETLLSLEQKQKEINWGYSGCYLIFITILLKNEDDKISSNNKLVCGYIAEVLFFGLNYFMLV